MCTYYVDLDSDGFGDIESAWEAACGADDLRLGGDCNDLDENIHPDAYELCNGRDDDCDGGVDVEAEDADRWYRDRDDDGWGNPDESARSCTQPDGWTAEAGDCDDEDYYVNPTGIEVCNELDDDCNGSVDDDPADPLTFYVDGDLDGFGDPATYAHSCLAPTGYVANAGDCYDANPDASPNQTLFFDVDRGDGSFDYDCDGAWTQAYPDFGACNWSTSSCSLNTAGWWEWSIPTCGESGDLLYDCSGAWSCTELTTSTTQSCL